MAADLDLVQASQALTNTRGEAAAIHEGAVPTPGIDDGADGAFDPDPAVHLAHLLVRDREVAVLPPAEDRLRSDDPMNDRRVLSLDDEKDEDVRRSERALARMEIRRSARLLFAARVRHA